MLCHGVYPIVEDQTAVDLTRFAESRPPAQGCLGARHSVANPADTATKPPRSIQTALSVGDPVKNLETSELKEFVALNPTTMSTIPPTRSATETILFINDL
jgi:hypothetical protein